MNTTAITAHADLEIELLHRATREYLADLNDAAVQQMPSSTMSGFEGDVFVLRNVRGVLARFTYDAAADKLTRIEEPAQ